MISPQFFSYNKNNDFLPERRQIHSLVVRGNTNDEPESRGESFLPHTRRFKCFKFLYRSESIQNNRHFRNMENKDPKRRKIDETMRRLLTGAYIPTLQLGTYRMKTPDRTLQDRVVVARYTRRNRHGVDLQQRSWMRTGCKIHRQQQDT